ncbi:hypothetical protein [Photobacterium leiognathi]|uniref:hypothetical protein n=1 Tax=Photobacterium leiognathi TaxID=553611 RepID=UPI003AF3C42F
MQPYRDVLALNPACVQIKYRYYLCFLVLFSAFFPVAYHTTLLVVESKERVAQSL